MQLEGQEFDAFFCSPLQRAAVTGRIIWAGRQGTAQATLSDHLQPQRHQRPCCSALILASDWQRHEEQLCACKLRCLHTAANTCSSNL